VRTLVISDLHLGNRRRHDVLRRPAALEPLLTALADVDRLVLLGDVAELMIRGPRAALGAAEPVLRSVGAALDRHSQVVLVPGNHDWPLVGAWVRARGPALGVDDEVPIDAAPALARVAGWLGPDRVSVRYPGVWLDERTYATHGHYIDRHLIPSGPVGLPRHRLGRRPVAAARPFDYERRRRIPTKRSRGAAIGRTAGRFLLGTAPRLVSSAGLSPITAQVLDLQMRHATLPALRLVLARLALEPETVIFGHVHRRGPLATDRLGDWARPGSPRALCTGSWLYEPRLTQSSAPPHPYWPGGGVLLEYERPARSIGLLDDLDHEQIRPGRSPR
jgi:hypothetical protein